VRRATLCSPQTMTCPTQALMSRSVAGASADAGGREVSRAGQAIGFGHLIGDVTRNAGTTSAMITTAPAVRVNREIAATAASCSARHWR
jgi:hypothetical protein